MPATRFKPYPAKAPKREPKPEAREDDLSAFPKLLIDFLKRGVAASMNLFGIGATDTEDYKNGANSQDEGDDQDAMQDKEDGSGSAAPSKSKSANGKEKLYPDIDVDKELDAARSAALPFSAPKRRRSSAEGLLDEELFDPERISLRQDDRLALLDATSTPPKVQVTTLPITSPFVQRKEHILDLTNQDDVAMGSDEIATPKTGAYAYSPTPEEARGMLAIESLVRGSYLDRARQIPTAYPNQTIDYDNYKYFPPYYTVIRPASKDVKDTVPHRAAPQETPSPGKMHSKESRKSRAPQKPRPTLPGRFSALDTDEEEEEIARILKEREQQGTSHQTLSAVATPEARKVQQVDDEELAHQKRVHAIRQQLNKINHPDRVSLLAMAEKFPSSVEASIEEYITKISKPPAPPAPIVAAPVSTLSFAPAPSAAVAPAPTFAPAPTAATKEIEKSDKEAAPVTSNWAAAGFKISAGDKWKCPTCDVQNDNAKDKCPCCDTRKPGAAAKEADKKPSAPTLLFGGPAATTTATTATSSTTTPAPPAFLFGPSTTTATTTAAATSPSNEKKEPAPAASNWAAAGFKFAANENKWKCPTCDSHNDSAKDKCACCDTAKPGGVSVADKGKEADKKEAAPPPVANNWAAAGFKFNTADKWKCPTCDSQNDNSKNKCACCETAKPGAAAAQPAAPSLSLFGTGTSTAASSTASTSAPPTILFGAPSTSAPASTTPASGFLFGAPSSTSAGASTSAASTTASSSTQPTFSFGSGTSKPSTVTATPALFTGFGSTPATTSVAAPASEPSEKSKPPSLFGSTALGTSTAASTGASVPTSGPGVCNQPFLNAVSTPAATASTSAPSTTGF
ncbi:hypothetical protein BGZ73_000570, partial [Actinomortierella ambigua]